MASGSKGNSGKRISKVKKSSLFFAHISKTSLALFMVAILLLAVVTSSGIGSNFQFIQPAQAQSVTIETSADDFGGQFFGEAVLKVVITDDDGDNDSVVEGVEVDIDATLDGGSTETTSFTASETDAASNRFEFYMVHFDATAVGPDDILPENDAGVEGASGAGPTAAPLITFGGSGGSDLHYTPAGSAGLYNSATFVITAGPQTVTVRYDQSAGTAQVDRTDYGTDNIVYLQILDQDGNLNPTRPDEFTVSEADLDSRVLFDLQGGFFENDITFEESAANSAEFEAVLQLGNDISIDSSSFGLMTLTFNNMANYRDSGFDSGENNVAGTSDIEFTARDVDGDLISPAELTFSSELIATLEDLDQNKDSREVDDIVPPAGLGIEVEVPLGISDTEHPTLEETDDNTDLFTIQLLNDQLPVTFLEDGASPAPDNGVLEFTPADVRDNGGIRVFYDDPSQGSEGSSITSEFYLFLTTFAGTVTLPDSVAIDDSFTLVIDDADLNNDARSAEEYTFELDGTGSGSFEYGLSRGGSPLYDVASLEFSFEGNPMDFATTLPYTLRESGINTGSFVVDIDMVDLVNSAGISPSDGDEIEITFNDKLEDGPTSNSDSFTISTVPGFTGSLDIVPTDFIGPATKVIIMVADADLGTTGVVDIVPNGSVPEFLTISSDRTGSNELETVQGRETGASTGVFEAELQLAPLDTGSIPANLFFEVGGDGTGLVLPGDLVSIRYNDALISGGGTQVVARVFEVMSFDPEMNFATASVTPGGSVLLTVVDNDADTDPTEINTIDIRVTSDSDIVGDELVAEETGENTGVFTVVVQTSTTGGIFVKLGDTITAEYTDSFPADYGTDQNSQDFIESIPVAMPPSTIVFTTNRDGNFEIYSMNADGSGQTRLTINPATDENPAISPDGTKIAFNSLRSGNQDIYVMNIDGSGVLKLTNNAADDSEPAWSPDGTKIAFRSNRDGSYDIFTMNADGTGQTRLNAAVAGFTESEPAWSPDGTKILFESNRDGPTEIYWMTIISSAENKLTTFGADEPQWSPDGSHIVFRSSRDGVSEIYSMNPDGSGVTRLTIDPAVDNDPTYSPDGTMIAFTSDRDGENEIFAMQADGSSPFKITNNAFQDFEPSWSIVASPPAMSEKLIFESDRDGDYEVYLMDMDGTDQENISNNPGFRDSEPDLSPDGSRVVFVSNRDGDNEIFVMDVDGSDQTQITTNTVDDFDPDWSPDGSKIAFRSNSDGDYDIYVVNNDGSGLIRVTSNTASDDDPTWSPDGSKIAFSSDRSGNRDIYVKFSDGHGHALTLTSNPADDREPTYSPDGSKIFFTSDRTGNNEIFVFGSGGGTVTQITNNPASDSEATVSPDGTKIAFTSDRDGNREIYLKNSDGTGSVTRLTSNVNIDSDAKFALASGEEVPTDILDLAVTFAESGRYVVTGQLIEASSGIGLSNQQVLLSDTYNPALTSVTTNGILIEDPNGLNIRTDCVIDIDPPKAAGSCDPDGRTFTDPDGYNAMVEVHQGAVITLPVGAFGATVTFQGRDSGEVTLCRNSCASPADDYTVKTSASGPAGVTLGKASGLQSIRVKTITGDSIASMSDFKLLGTNSEMVLLDSNFEIPARLEILEETAVGTTRLLVSGGAFFQEGVPDGDIGLVSTVSASVDFPDTSSYADISEDVVYVIPNHAVALGEIGAGGLGSGYADGNCSTSPVAGQNCYEVATGYSPASDLDADGLLDEWEQSGGIPYTWTYSFTIGASGTSSVLTLDGTNKAIAEQFTPASSAKGKSVKTVTLNLRKAGTNPTGTATVCVLDDNNNCGHIFGTVTVSSLSTTFTQVSFTHPTLSYTIIDNSRIGIKYLGSSTSKVEIEVTTGAITPDALNANSKLVTFVSAPWTSSDTMDCRNCSFFEVHNDRYSLCPDTCANYMHKDLFVEIDYMQYLDVPLTARNNVINAFASVPNDFFRIPNTDIGDGSSTDGITLHLIQDEQLPFSTLTQVWQDPAGASDNILDDVQDIKAANFGTARDRSDAIASGGDRLTKMLGAKATAYHYGLSVNGMDTSAGAICSPNSPSGQAEFGKNDFVIGLGCGTSTAAGTISQFAVAPASGSPSVMTLDGTNKAFAELFTPSSSAKGKDINTVKLNLRRTGSTPTGTVTACVLSDTNTCLFTFGLPKAVSTLSTTFAQVSFTNPDLVYRITDNSRIGIQYVGSANSKVEIEVTTGASDGNGANTKFSTFISSWADSDIDCRNCSFEYSVKKGSVNQYAGVLMHELGHNLGLDHGGPHQEYVNGVWTNIAALDYLMNCKINYPSVMSYSRLFDTNFLAATPPATYVLDFSGAPANGKYSMITDNALVEGTGVTVPAGAPARALLWVDTQATGGPKIRSGIPNPDDLDYNGGGIAAGTISTIDPNFFSAISDCAAAPTQRELSYNDWYNIIFDFRGTDRYVDSAPVPLIHEPTVELIEDLTEYAADLGVDTVAPGFTSMSVMGNSPTTATTSVQLSATAEDPETLDSSGIDISTGILSVSATIIGPIHLLPEAQSIVPIELALQPGGSYSATQSLTGQPDGLYEVHFRAEDNAHNTAEVLFGTFVLDNTAPTVGYALSTLPNPAGWHRVPLTITWNCIDSPPVSDPQAAVSGIASCDAPAVYSGPDSASTSVTGHGRDFANNQGTGTYSFKYDATPPTGVTVTGFTNGQVFFPGDTLPIVGCTADFGISGKASCTVTETIVPNPPGNTNGYGQHKFIATATDIAGNVATSPEVSYTQSQYTLTGFYSPVDMDVGATKVINTVKGGSTVPLKWEVFRGAASSTPSVAPNEITDISKVKSIQQLSVSCTTFAGASEDAIETVAAGDSVLKYEGGQFIYNWKTPKQAGTCWNIVMTMQDGSTLSAHFKLK